MSDPVIAANIFIDVFCSGFVIYKVYAVFQGSLNSYEEMKIIYFVI